MKKEWNLHELVRAVVDERRAAGATIDLEHRGDGDGEWDGEALATSLETLLASISAESIWMRTDGRPDDPVIHVRWHGSLVPADFSAISGEVSSSVVDGEARLEIRIPRR